MTKKFAGAGPRFTWPFQLVSLGHSVPEQRKNLSSPAVVSVFSRAGARVARWNLPDHRAQRPPENKKENEKHFGRCCLPCSPQGGSWWRPWQPRRCRRWRRRRRGGCSSSRSKPPAWSGRSTSCCCSRHCYCCDAAFACRGLDWSWEELLRIRYYLLRAKYYVFCITFHV